MLSTNQVDSLVEARHGDPFAALGLHADAAGTLWCRAMLPGAASVAVVDAATNNTGADFGRTQSIVLIVPPLATVFLVPA